ncbi:MAG: hypothetical protein FWD18_02785 [Micrococcales bacterium]|nr:hypothetical protein [Micrococcales bacterium]
MTLLEIVALVGIVAVVLLWLAWVRASRLDRLHRKVTSARVVVTAQLVRRATVAAELATSGLLDPVSSVVLGESAWQALAASTAATPPESRALLGAAAPPAAQQSPGSAESELTATLTEVLSDPDEVERLRREALGEELLGQLAAAWYRVQVARRIHNEAVAQALRIRRSRVVRLFRLAGHAAAPTTLELDDSWPETLSGYGRS